MKININYNLDEYIDASLIGLSKSPQLRSKSSVLKTAKNSYLVYNESLKDAKEILKQYEQIIKNLERESDPEKVLLLLAQAEIAHEDCSKLIDLCIRFEAGFEELKQKGKQSNVISESEFLRKYSKKFIKE